MLDTNQIYLSIIIPAYNEGQKITEDLAAAHNYLEEHNINGEILVIDDGSSDNTSEIVKSKQTEIPCLKLITFKKNYGKGHSLRKGVSKAKGKYIMFADAGLCVPYKYIEFGIFILEMGKADIAHGSRRYGNSKIEVPQPMYRQIGSKIFGFLIKFIFGIPLFITDTQCGFKIYRGNIARKLYKTCFTDGFMIDIETIFRAKRMNYSIMEFPVVWSNDSDTRYDPIWGTLRNLKELLKIRFTI